MSQLGLFKEQELKEKCQVETITEVKLGKRSAMVNLGRKNKNAVKKLREILAELEGKDSFISHNPSGSFFWEEKLRLNRLHTEWINSWSFRDESQTPSVIVLWGTRGSQVRILHPNKISDVRVQRCASSSDMDKAYYLVDFWNGFWSDPIDKYQQHYDCLHIERVS